MSVLIVRDTPEGNAQVLLDGKDISAELYGLSVRIEPGKKVVVLEFKPAGLEIKVKPDVLMEGKPSRRETKHAAD